MTKNEIIQSLYQSKDIDDALSKMDPPELREDLKQEIFMVICEIDELKLIEMYEKGYLKFYLVRTMLNMIKSNRGTFFRNFRNYTELSTFDSEEIIEEELPTIEIDKIFGTSRQGLYEKDMFLYYVYTFKHNAAKLSQATKIPYKTVIRTIKNAKCKIKSYLRSSDQ